MALFQLIYMGSLNTDGPEILLPILEFSIRNNERGGITGMMLYADGNVMHALEGEKDKVLETFRTIESDIRHKGLFVLLEEEIASRQFAFWSMGFRQLTAVELEKIPVAAHVFKVRQDEISRRVRAGDARTVLQSFAKGCMRII